MTHLMLNTRVLALRVLTNEHRVEVVVGSLEALDGHTRTHICEQVERPAKRQVERDVTLANYTMYVSNSAHRQSNANYALGVARGLLSATVFLRTDWMAASGMAVLPFLRIGVTSTSSHWIGTCNDVEDTYYIARTQVHTP